MNKLLVVGGEGYIAKALLPKLSSSYEIYVTTRKDKTSKLFLDLSDTQSIKTALSTKYDTILFLASNISGLDNACVDFSAEPFSSNTEGLNNFLSILSSVTHQTKFVYASSMTVYSKEAVSPVSEDAATVPLHAYGLSKLMAETIVSHYAHNFDIPSLVLRIPGVFGEDRTDGYIAAMANKLAEHKDVSINAKKLGFWEAIYINDLTQIVSSLLESFKYKTPYEIINVSYGEECDFVNTAFMLKKLCGSNSEITVESAEYVKFYMDNTKLKRYVDMSTFSYEKALKAYLDDRCDLQ